MFIFRFQLFNRLKYLHKVHPVYWLGHQKWSKRDRHDITWYQKIVWYHSYESFASYGRVNFTRWSESYHLLLIFHGRKQIKQKTSRVSIQHYSIQLCVNKIWMTGHIQPGPNNWGPIAINFGSGPIWPSSWRRQPVCENFMEPRIFGPGGSALKNFRKFPVGWQCRQLHFRELLSCRRHVLLVYRNRNLHHQNHHTLILLHFRLFLVQKLPEIAKNRQKLAYLILARYLPKISNKNEPNNSQNITKSKLKWNKRSKFTTKGVQI